MTFGCTVPNSEPNATPEHLRATAVRAEELGFDHIWVGDHVVMPTQVASPYPYTETGASPFNPEDPWCDPIATMCYLAGCTQRIKVGACVLVLPYREPVVTAKMVSTLDYMCGGRVILGVGVGWMEEEFKALGLNTFRERGKVSDEQIRVFKELWTKDDPEFHGEYYQFSSIKFSPKPVQKPHPPIWVGGHTNAALRRAANLCDGWLPVGLRPRAGLEAEDMAELIDSLRDMTEEAGRPRDAVDVIFSANLSFGDQSTGPRPTMTGSPEDIAADIVLYQQVGVNHFIFRFRADEPEHTLHDMERFAKDVRPQLS